jgi:uncharacterized SAM-binding protein YcdF (DUF218 family)
MVRSVTFEKRISAAASKRYPGNATMIYVLGGNQSSLAQRFREASILYHQGVAGTIHIMSRPGITEFSPELRRNLTNDEWSIRELEALGVKRGDVIPVSVPPSYFGTMSEAKRISGIAREKGYKRLVLVSSLYHTRRLHNSFTPFLATTPVEIYIHGVDGDAGIKELVSENIKLFLYDHAVLPTYAR